MPIRDHECVLWGTVHILSPRDRMSPVPSLGEGAGRGRSGPISMIIYASSYRRMGNLPYFQTHADASLPRTRPQERPKEQQGTAMISSAAFNGRQREPPFQKSDPEDLPQSPRFAEPVRA